MIIFSYSNPFGPTNAGWKSVWSPELSRFAAVSGADNTVTSSADGLTWEAPSSFESGSSVCWSPDLGIFCAVGNNAATSPDGITWTDHGAFVAAAGFGYGDVCWSPDLGIFCAVSGGYFSATSSDGATWAEVPQSVFPADDIVWVGSQFVAFGGGAGTVYSFTSPDGVTWTSHSTPISGIGAGIAWSPGLSQFVGVVQPTALGGDEIVTSPDGVTWTNQGAPLASDAGWDVCWSPDRSEYAAVAGASLYTSPDGISWTYEGTPFTPHSYGVEWSPALGVYLVLGTNGDGSQTAAIWPVTLDSGLHIAGRF